VGRPRRADRVEPGIPASGGRRLLREVQPLATGHGHRRDRHVNLRLATAPGNVLLPADLLPKPSVVNVTQLVAVDRSLLDGQLAVVPSFEVREIDRGLALVLGLRPGG